MTQEELEAANAANDQVHIKGSMSQVAEAGLKGAATGAVVEGVLSAVEDGVSYRKGEIDGKEYAQKVGRKAATGAVVGGAMGAGGAALGAMAPVTAAALAPVALGLAVYGALTVTVRLGEAAKEHYNISKVERKTKVASEEQRSGAEGAKRS